MAYRLINQPAFGSPQPCFKHYTYLEMASWIARHLAQFYGEITVQSTVEEQYFYQSSFFPYSKEPIGSYLPSFLVEDLLVGIYLNQHSHQRSATLSFDITEQVSVPSIAHFIVHEAIEERGNLFNTIQLLSWEHAGDSQEFLGFAGTMETKAIVDISSSNREEFKKYAQDLLPDGLEWDLHFFNDYALFRLETDFHLPYEKLYQRSPRHAEILVNYVAQRAIEQRADDELFQLLQEQILEEFPIIQFNKTRKRAKKRHSFGEQITELSQKSLETA